MVNKYSKNDRLGKKILFVKILREMNFDESKTFYLFWYHRIFIMENFKPCTFAIDLPVSDFRVCKKSNWQFLNSKSTKIDFFREIDFGNIVWKSRKFPLTNFLKKNFVKVTFLLNLMSLQTYYRGDFTKYFSVRVNY